MYFAERTIMCPLVEYLTYLLDFRLKYYLFLNWSVTVPITNAVPIPGVVERKRGHNKMADIDIISKQRMVIEFLTAENISPEEIHARLMPVYGADTIDLDGVKGWCSRPGQSDMMFRGRLVYRAVIQFLTAEGAKPLEIAQRLASVYRTVSYSAVTVWRWASRYLKGDTTVCDKYRQGRLPSNATILTPSENGS